MASGEACNVKVVVRVRPLNKKEIADGRKKIVQMDTKMGLVQLFNPEQPDSATKSFTFDAAFDENCTQMQVYQETAYPIVQASLEGYNGTIFAYGQTGTGKTHTMEGVHEVKELRGIIPNSFQHIFDAIAMNTKAQYLVRASYLEIYNENVRDLLAQDPTNKLELKEHPETGVYVKDLSQTMVKTVQEMDQVMRYGNANRSVGETKMNATSSRSHSIYTIIIEASEPSPDGNPKPLVRQGKLNLVDLAGSERQSKTGATGDRLTEATKINLSLSALGNVISALVDGKSKHIPYRDSKLTRLLQDSLGGNSKTVMVANMGPADWNFEETLSTLRYANRAKMIKNQARINEDPKDAMLRQLAEELDKLKKALSGEGPMPGFEGTYSTMEEIAGESGVDPELLEKLKGEQDAEIQRVLESRGVALSERERIAHELTVARERAEAEAQAKAALMAKLQMVQAKLVSGSLIDENAKQEAEIRRRQAELEQRELEQRHLEREIAEREAKAKESEQKYQSLQEEATGLNKKMKSLWQKLQDSKAEIQDLQAEFSREKDELMNNLRELNVQIQLKNLIIDNFIPPDEVKKIEERAEWDDQGEQWNVSHRGFLEKNRDAIRRPPSAIGWGRPITEYARAAANGGDNPRFRNNNILIVELDMPERTTTDYDGPSVEPRIKDAVQQAMTEEQDLAIEAKQNLPQMGRPGGVSTVSPAAPRRRVAPAATRSSPATGRVAANGKTKSAPSLLSGSGGKAAEGDYPESRGLLKKKKAPKTTPM